ncbi:multicopper oxidase family protein [Aquipuribacter sp. MA13-6]|uniref:multicopper oxidase family protein n=1 Tax=unclassified Aquipuribacter TaxID=2635084 RepID=UPI003EEF44AF
MTSPAVQAHHPTPPAPGRRGRGAVVLAVVVSVTVPVMIAVVGAVALWWNGRTDTVGAVTFERPLRIPALAASTVDAGGTRVFDLTMQTGRTDLTGRGDTETWGVDGAHLAPTVRVQRGERVRVDVRNELPETSTLHWHGLHVPAASDGGPHRLVRPGGSWSPSWRVDQPATSGWYHPHAHGTTAEHVRRGVYGMFLVDDPAAAPGGLPDGYGVDDVPVMVQDVRLGGDGSLARGNGFLEVTGPLGDTLLVNGTVGPFLDVTTEAVRLRLLNASAARVYDFVLDDGRPMDLVATDGGLLPAPVSTGSVMLSPGERAEVVVRVGPGERVVLQSRPPDLGVAGVMARMSGAGDRFDVLELRAAERLRASPPLAGTLAPAPDLAVQDATVTRTFDLAGGNAINGLRMDMSRVDEVAETGTTEEWAVRNLDGMPHNFHLHGTSFVVAELDGSPPPAHLTGWKDTVLLPPGGVARLVVRHDGPPDPDAPYLYHCHLLAHHDQGMMGQLVLVGPGGEAGDVHDASHEVATPSTDRQADGAARLFPGAAGHEH